MAKLIRKSEEFVEATTHTKLIDKFEKEAEQNIVSDWIFTLGVCTIMTKVFLFAAYPQYFFIFCLIQAPIFFYIRFSLSWRKKQALYFVEWCWPINALGWLYLAFEAADVFTSF